MTGKKTEISHWTMCRNEQVFVLPLVLSFTIIFYAFMLSCFHQNKPNEPSLDSLEGPGKVRGTRAVDTLQFIVVVSRHGNRRLELSFPNDPYPLNDTKFWPYGTHELTTHGRIQMFQLGEKIRSLYNGFLDVNYRREEFYASSTAMDRVVMSGEMFSAGLYPPTGFQVWNKSIAWQPVPIYSNSLDKTKVVEENCTLYLYELVNSLAKYLDQNSQDLKSVNSYVSQFAGTKLKGLEGLVAAFDTFLSEDCEGYKLPDWTKEVYPLPINDLVSKLYVSTFAGSDKMTQLVIGPFLNDIVDTMKSKVNGTLVPDRKLHYYSGHDASLITLQVALGIPHNSTIGVVRPGSAMVYELHKLPNNTFSMQVLYVDGGTSSLGVPDPFLLEIPDCGYRCDFRKFLNITSKYCVVIDYGHECK